MSSSNLIQVSEMESLSTIAYNLEMLPVDPDAALAKSVNA